MAQVKLCICRHSIEPLQCAYIKKKSRLKSYQNLDWMCQHGRVLEVLVNLLYVLSAGLYVFTEKKKNNLMNVPGIFEKDLKYIFVSLIMYLPILSFVDYLCDY